MTSADPADERLPTVGELLELIEQLDADNERLRVERLELAKLVEDAVTEQVAGERRIAELETRVGALEAELQAIAESRLMRFARPVREVYGRLADPADRRRGAGDRRVAADAVRPARPRGVRTSPEASHVMTDQYPVFIPVRDRVTPLRQVIDWLERAGQEQIWLIDNASTYGPLLDYLDATPHHVVRLTHNLGHRSPWMSGTVQRIAHGRHFVVTDPDVVPDEECPLDAIDHFRTLLDRHDGFHKAGFGLRIDDLPDSYPLAAAVRAWESRFWRDEIEPHVYHADIDTTFALYRPVAGRHDEHLSIRTGPPYVARHLPWYVDAAALSDEERYYRAHADPSISNWDRDQLPRWKRRWLEARRAESTGS